MTVKQFAVRMAPEGGHEVIAEVRAASNAVVQGADAGAAANQRAQTASLQHAEALKILERNAARAGKTLMQARIDALAGGSIRTQLEDQMVLPQRASSTQARAALLYRMDDAQEARAKAVKAALDPLGAAQDRLNDELREYDTLLKANKLTVQQHAQAQALAKTRYDETALAIQRQERGLSRLAMASRLNLARQGADVLTTAAMGMNPGMIAIQQGPQILDAWATSAIKVTPLMIGLSTAVLGTAAAAAVAGAAYLKAEDSYYALDRATSGLGITSGLTTTQLMAMARAGAQAGDISKAAGEKLAATYVSTGRIGGEIMTDLIAVTKDWASVTGQELGKAGEDLAEMMLKPDESARELTRSIGLLDQESLKLIDTLVEQGKTAEAQRILLDALTESARGHAERIGDIETAWEAVWRRASDYFTDLGTWLQQTDDERLTAIDQRLGRWQARGVTGANNIIARAYELERNALLRQDLDDGRRQIESEGNQAAQLAADREAAAKKERDKAAREAARQAREADRARREALARGRREEDRQLALDQQIARATGDEARVRELERESAILARQRELIDDGMAAEAARTQAVRERIPLEEALADASDREFRAYARRFDVQQALALGDQRSARSLQDQMDLETRINELRRLGFDTVTATAAAQSMQNDLLADRAVLMDREIARARLSHEIALARARGDETALRTLERREWIDGRAREIEQRESLNRGEGVKQATREWAELWQAEADGARRAWVSGFLDDLRSGEVEDILGNQFERAADRLADRLVDVLTQIDWAELLGGGGGGRWDSVLASVFGPSFSLGSGSTAAKLKAIGKNAEGTEYWRGGWTWVGERGRELAWLPEGTEVKSYGQSPSAARAASLAPARAALAGPPSLTIHNYGSEPVSARVTQGADGGLDLELEPLFRKMVPRVAGDPAVRNALAAGGKVKRRR